MKIIYKDGTEENFEADTYEINEEGQFVTLIKRNYDDDGDYDENEDKEIALISQIEIRCIKIE